MIYQFVDWRIGLLRRMCVVQVDSLFPRLRDANGGVLPHRLETFEHRVIFAGESRINLPENQAVAESITVSDGFPAFSWLDKRYEELLTYIGNTAPELLIDPTPAPLPKSEDPSSISPPTGDPLVVDPVASAQAALNATLKDGEQCSEPDRPTTTPTSTSDGSPNSSLTKKNPSPQRPPSTRTGGR